jgi:D-ribose pyranase
MLKSSITNPHLLSLLARVRHTNTLVIADRGFPSWPNLEIIDLSLIDNIPTVLDVLAAIRPNFIIGRAWMAAEFQQHNSPAVITRFADALSGISLTYEPHLDFKKRVPLSTGLIRTADTLLYSNLLLESA